MAIEYKQIDGKLKKFQKAKPEKELGDLNKMECKKELFDLLSKRDATMKQYLSNMKTLDDMVTPNLEFFGYADPSNIPTLKEFKMSLSK